MNRAWHQKNFFQNENGADYGAQFMHGILAKNFEKNGI